MSDPPRASPSPQAPIPLVLTSSGAPQRPSTPSAAAPVTPPRAPPAAAAPAAPALAGTLGEGPVSKPNLVDETQNWFGLSIAASKQAALNNGGGPFWETSGPGKKKVLKIAYGMGNKNSVSAARVSGTIEATNLAKNPDRQSLVKAVRDIQSGKYKAVTMRPSNAPVNQDGIVGNFYGFPLYNSAESAKKSSSAVRAHLQPSKGKNAGKMKTKVSGPGLPTLNIKAVEPGVRAGLLQANFLGQKRENVLLNVIKKAMYDKNLMHKGGHHSMVERIKAGKKAVEKKRSTSPLTFNGAKVVRASIIRKTENLNDKDFEKMRRIAITYAPRNAGDLPVPVVFTRTSGNSDVGVQYVAVAPWVPPGLNKGEREIYQPKIYFLPTLIPTRGNTASDANVAKATLRKLEEEIVEKLAKHRKGQNQRQNYVHSKQIQSSGALKEHLLNVFRHDNAPAGDSLQRMFKNMFEQRETIKHKLLGIVGSRKPDMSLAEQIKLMVNGEGDIKWCDFSPSSTLVWDVGGTKIFALQPWQAIVFALARLRARELAFKKNGMKLPPPGKLPAGLLAHHSTGSGKTLTLLSVLLAFWNNKDMAIMPLAVRSNAADNNLDKLVALARKHFPFFHNTAYPDLARYPFANNITQKESYAALAERLVQGYLKLAGKEANKLEWLRLAKLSKDVSSRKNSFLQHDGQFNETRLLYSYQVFANDTFDGTVFPKTGISNTVFLCDEIQYLVGAPASSEVSQRDGYERAKQALNNRNAATCWAVGASATPGDSSREFLEILSILSKEKITTVEHVEEKAHGLISYANLLGSKSQFAPLQITNECVDVQSAPTFWKWFALKALGIQPRQDADVQEINRQKFTLSNGLRQKILDSIGHLNKVPTLTVANSTWKYNSMNPVKYMSRFRLMANFIRLETETTRGDVRYSPLLKTWVTRTDQQSGAPRKRQTTFVIGPKLMLLLKRINENPQKLHYVYATDMNTLFLVAALLERDLNMALYHDGVEKGKKTFGFIDSNTSTQTTEAFKKYLNYSKDQVAAVKKRASADDNRRGKYVHVLLATKDSFKGVDVKNITHLHLLDAFADWQRLQQFLGRGPRMCAHAKFSPEDAKVQVHVYKLSDKALGIHDAYVFADSVLWKEAWERYEKEWGHLEETVRKVAVDAKVFRPFSDKIKKLGEIISMPCVKQDLHAPRMLNLRTGGRRSQQTDEENGANDEANTNGIKPLHGNSIGNGIGNGNGNGNGTNNIIGNVYMPLRFTPKQGMRTRGPKNRSKENARIALKAELEAGTLQNNDLKNFIQKHNKWLLDKVPIEPEDEEKLIRQHRRLQKKYSNALPEISNNLKVLRLNNNNRNLVLNKNYSNGNNNNDNNNNNVGTFNVQAVRRELTPNTRQSTPETSSRNQTPGSSKYSNGSNSNSNKNGTLNSGGTLSKEMANLMQQAAKAAMNLRESKKAKKQKEKEVFAAEERVARELQKISNGKKFVATGNAESIVKLKRQALRNQNANVKLKEAATQTIKEKIIALKAYEKQKQAEDKAAAAAAAAAARKKERNNVRAAKKKEENDAKAAKQKKRNNAAAAKQKEEAEKQKKRNNVAAKKAAAAAEEAALKPYKNALGPLTARKKEIEQKKSAKNSQDKANLKMIKLRIKDLKDKMKDVKTGFEVKQTMMSMLNTINRQGSGIRI